MLVHNFSRLYVLFSPRGVDSVSNGPLLVVFVVGSQCSHVVPRGSVPSRATRVRRPVGQTTPWNRTHRLVSNRHHFIFKYLLLYFLQKFFVRYFRCLQKFIFYQHLALCNFCYRVPRVNFTLTVETSIVNVNSRRNVHRCHFYKSTVKFLFFAHSLFFLFAKNVLSFFVIVAISLISSKTSKCFQSSIL